MPRSAIRQRVTGALLILAGVAAAQAQDRSPQAPAPSRGAAIAVDFRVLSADGQPVLDLKPEQLTLKVDGRPPEVRSLAHVQFGRTPAGAGSALLPPPFASNTDPPAGRDTILVIDDESFPPGKEEPVRTAVGQLLAGLPLGDLPPGDYAVRAIASLDGQPVGQVVRTLRKAPVSAGVRPPG